MTADPVPPAHGPSWWEGVRRAPVALIYKHSPFCGASAAAQRQVAEFSAAHPAVPLYRVDVIRERALSSRIAEALDVVHESPQLILLRDGLPVWVTSHRGISADAIQGAVGGAATRWDARPG